MAEPSLKHAASLVPVGPFAGKPAMPLTRSVVVVGSGKNSRVLLKSDTVSTVHTLLLHTRAGWCFRDLCSRTHTILNGKSTREGMLRNGDTITIGSFVFLFVTDQPKADPAPVRPAALEVTEAEIPVPIDTRTMLIGRRVGCEVRLIEESASLVHAAIFEADGDHYVRDLYSRSGTFVNGLKVHQARLNFGDEIRVGDTTLRYIPDTSEYATPVDEPAPAADANASIAGSGLGSGLLDRSHAPLAITLRDEPRRGEPDDHGHAPLVDHDDARETRPALRPQPAPAAEAPAALPVIQPVAPAAPAAEAVPASELFTRRPVEIRSTLPPGLSSLLVESVEELRDPQPPHLLNRAPVPQPVAEPEAGPTPLAIPADEFSSLSIPAIAPDESDQSRVLPLASRGAFDQPGREAAQAEVTPEVEAAPETVEATELEVAEVEPSAPAVANQPVTVDVEPVQTAPVVVEPVTVEPVPVEPVAIQPVADESPVVTPAADHAGRSRDIVEAVGELDVVDLAEVDIAPPEAADEVSSDQAPSAGDVEADVLGVAPTASSEALSDAAAVHDVHDDVQITEDPFADEVVAEAPPAGPAIAPASSGRPASHEVHDDVLLADAPADVNEREPDAAAVAAEVDDEPFTAPPVSATTADTFERVDDVLLPPEPSLPTFADEPVADAAVAERSQPAEVEPVAIDVDVRDAAHDADADDDELEPLAFDTIPDAFVPLAPIADVFELDVKDELAPQPPAAPTPAEAAAIIEAPRRPTPIEELAAAAEMTGAVTAEGLPADLSGSPGEAAAIAGAPTLPPVPQTFPPSPEVAELAQLQARIREALEDPASFRHRPLTPPPGVQSPDPLSRMSEASRRMHMIAEMLETTEEFEEDAEREAQSIEFPTVPESEIPKVEPIVEPPLVEAGAIVGEATVAPVAPAAEVAPEPAVEPSVADAIEAHPTQPVLDPIAGRPDPSIPDETTTVGTTTGDATAFLAPATDTIVPDDAEVAQPLAASQAQPTPPSTNDAVVASTLDTPTPFHVEADVVDHGVVGHAAVTLDAASSADDVARADAVAIAERLAQEAARLATIRAALQAPVDEPDPLLASAPALEATPAAPAEEEEPTGKRGRGRKPKKAPARKPPKAKLAADEARATFAVQPLDSAAPDVVDAATAAAAAAATAEAVTDAELIAEAQVVADLGAQAPDDTAAVLDETIVARSETAAETGDVEVMQTEAPTETAVAADAIAEARQIADAPIDPALADRDVIFDPPADLVAEPQADLAEPPAEFVAPVLTPDEPVSESADDVLVEAVAGPVAEPVSAPVTDAEAPIAVDPLTRDESAGETRVELLAPDQAAAAVAHAEAIVETSLSPTTLDALAHAAPTEQPGIVDEVREPADLVAQPDEQPVEVAEAYAPIEITEPQAGEVISTAPTTFEAGIPLIPVSDSAATEAVGATPFEPTHDEAMGVAPFEAALADATIPASPVADAHEDQTATSVEPLAEAPIDPAAEPTVVEATIDQAALDQAPERVIADADEPEQEAPLEWRTRPLIAADEHLAEDALDELPDIDSLEPRPVAVTRLEERSDLPLIQVPLAGEQASDASFDQAGPPPELVADLSFTPAAGPVTEPDAGQAFETTIGSDQPAAPASPFADADAPKPVAPVRVQGVTSPATSVVNVNVPSLEELEASFNDAFAEALAMADGHSFAKPRPPVDPNAPVAEAPAPAAPKFAVVPIAPQQPAAGADVPVIRRAVQRQPFVPPTAEAPAADAPRPAQQPSSPWKLDESLLEQNPEFDAPRPAPVAPRAPVDRPEWKLDESLLDQAGDGVGLPGAMGGAGGVGTATPGGFLNLGGIGWIGDPSVDEHEQIPTSFTPGLPGARPSNRPARKSRQRRPLPGQTPPAPETVAGDAPAQPDTTPAERMSPVAEAPATDESPRDDGDFGTADARPATLEPQPDAGAAATVDLSDELAIVPASRAATPLDLQLSDAPIVDLNDDGPVVGEIDEDDTVDALEVTSEAGTEIAPVAPALPVARPPRPAAPLLPPRPRRPRKGEALVDQSLESAAAASPFAEQTLPLVDAFSQSPQAGLDEMLARIGPHGGEVTDIPPITQDLPVVRNRQRPQSQQAQQGNEIVPATPTPAPFASQVPIQQPTGGGGARRTRQQISKLPLIIMLMLAGWLTVALGAWYVPVPVTVRGELSFTNLNRLNELDRAAKQDLIKQKLEAARPRARQLLSDEYGNGFIDRPGEYRQVVDEARFDVNDPNTLVIAYRSNVNQVDADVARMATLIRAVQAESADLLDEQAKLQQSIRTLETQQAKDREELARVEAERIRQHAIADSSPTIGEKKQLAAEVAKLEETRKAAARDVDANEAQLKRLEAELLSSATRSQELLSVARQMASLFLLFEATDQPATTRPAERAAMTDLQADLAKLKQEREAAQQRLAQLTQAQSPEARQARQGFDESLGAFAADVEAARKSIGDRPEVLAYVESAQRLQDQIRTITDTLVRRQQQQLTRMAEFQRQLTELTDSTRDQRYATDGELKQWKDRLSIQQRRLNAAHDAGAGAEEVSEIEKDIQFLEASIAARQEILNDPKASTVTQQLQQMMEATQREMTQDREQNEKLLAGVQESFRKQQPAVASLPADQKQLGETLAARLAQIDLARQRYTDSLALVAGGDELEMTQTRQKLQQLDAQIAVRQKQADDSAAEMERRMQLAKQVDAARAAVIAARAARDQAEKDYFAKAEALEAVTKKIEIASVARQEKERLEALEKQIKERSEMRIVQIKEQQNKLDYAVVPIPPVGATARAIDPQRMDPRWMYGAAGVAAVSLLFVPLMVRESRSRQPLGRRVRSLPAAEIPSNATIA